jgi:hypothetical protein
MRKMVWLIRLRRALCVTFVLAGAGCGTHVASGDSRSAASDDASVLVLTDAVMWYTDQAPDFGIHVEGKFTPDRDGTTTGPATIDIAGRSLTEPFVYPPNWDTDQWPPAAHQSLRSGQPMAVNEDVTPVCDGEAHDPPLISVPYRTADGTEATLKVAIAATRTSLSPTTGPPQNNSVAETAAYIDDATRQFCSHDLLFHIGVTSRNPSTGEVFLDYMLTNPGPDTVTVMSKAWQGPDGARWLATSPIEVPADGQKHKLRVFGVEGACDEPSQTPRSLGLLVVTHSDGTSNVIEGSDHIDACHFGQ